MHGLGLIPSNVVGDLFENTLAPQCLIVSLWTFFI